MSNQFTILENNLVKTNTVKYKDDFNNIAMFKRKGEGFVFRIRFADKTATAEPIYVENTKEEEGNAPMKLFFMKDGVMNKPSETVENGIEAAKPLFNHLYKLATLLNLLEKVVSIPNNASGSEYVFNMLLEFEETKDLANMVMKRPEVQKLL